MEKQMKQGSRELHKSRQGLKVLQTDSEAPAALGRTNMKNLLFFCPVEKLSMGSPGDLRAQQMLPAVAGL